jgi:hypothetical protein
MQRCRGAEVRRSGGAEEINPIRLIHHSNIPFFAAFADEDVCDPQCRRDVCDPLLFGLRKNESQVRTNQLTTPNHLARFLVKCS